MSTLCSSRDATRSAQSMAKLLSKHLQSHNTRVRQSLGRSLDGLDEITADVSKVSVVAQQASTALAKTVMDWSKEATVTVTALVNELEGRHQQTLAVRVGPRRPPCEPFI